MSHIKAALPEIMVNLKKKFLIEPHIISLTEITRAASLYFNNKSKVIHVK